MSTTASRRFYEEQIPPFMAVFDLDQAMQDQDTVTVVDPKMMEIESNCNPKLHSDPSQLLQPPAIPPNHQHRDSTSTHTSESADSSPTTTVSCTDSSSFSDPSPSSSPDSPVNLVPLNAFPSTTFGALPSMATLSVSEPGHRLRRPMTSPAPRRPRNMKGLSIQPPFASSAASSSLVSEPSSPSFIKPKIPAMKRKPSQLSLKTNSDDLVGRSNFEIPQSPSVPALAQRRALKHSMSSPHMLSGLKSSTFGPAGGMTFPTVFERNESGLSSFLRPSKPPSCHDADDAIMEEDSPIRSQMANRAAFDTEPFHEKESNEDQKPLGYPDGPIAIYGDNVYLYLEPTAEEASNFDVVINVAREVANPFEARSARDEYMQDMSPVPDTALTNSSFATAFEFMPDDMTPTTPKAMTPKRPEYIHMPWDHNTDISHDLMHLCETIERKTLAGKKVLVHCQQGASRSASLIIAYGLYQNPEMSVNDAYYAAQSKSKWISPNMRLMYCLQDFQKEVSKKRLSPNPVYKPRSGRSPSKHRMTLSVDAIDVPKEPRTAPLPEEDTAPRNQSPTKSQLRARGHSTPEQISPGPSSAPSSLSWAQKFVGILGGTFVPCQVWTTGFFDRNIVGTANALVGGWGNSGGGITYFVMPAIYDSLRLERGLSSHVAWRVSFIVPFILITLTATGLLLLADDTPTGSWADRGAVVVRSTHQSNVVATTGGIMDKPQATNGSISSSDEKKKVPERDVESASTSDDGQILDEVQHEVVVKPTLKEAIKVLISPQTIMLCAGYFCSFGGELAINSVLGSYYLKNFPYLGQTQSGRWAAMFGLLNIITRPLGGFIGDLIYKYTHGNLWAKKCWIHFVGVMSGIFMIVIGKLNPHDLDTMIGLIALMAIFLEAGNGANFALVPHIHPHANGILSGIVGATGNFGGIIFAIIFRYNPGQYARVFWIMGCMVIALNLCLAWVRPIPKGQIGGR